MTKSAEKKIDNLIKITRENLARVHKRADNSPFAGTGAKYYPAIKKLASK